MLLLLSLAVLLSALLCVWDDKLFIFFFVFYFQDFAVLWVCGVWGGVMGCGVRVLLFGHIISSLLY